MEEKIYVGKGKEFGNYGNIGFSINLDAVMPHAYEFEGKRYVKLTIGKMRQADQYGKTHTISVDTWKPDQNAPKADARPVSKTPPASSIPVIDYPEEDINPNEIPF